MPEPLVPPHVDLRDFQFMPVDVVRLRDSDLAALESPEACWAAVLLWCASWHQIPAASIPDDDRVLANLAGFGRVVREWMRVRSGALRGWVKCDDGRLYHPVVAEKALEAWEKKLRQRWAAECARIRKHNERHGSGVPSPDFDTWKASGCHAGQRLDVTRDSLGVSHGSPRETPSKGQGQGQGQGQGSCKPPSSVLAAASPDPQNPPARAGSDKYRYSDEDMAAAQYIATWVAEVAPSVKPNLKDWANEVRLMRERDGRQHREVCEMFRWAHADTFWRANILSVGSLRRHWPKLEAKRRATGTRQPWEDGESSLSPAGRATAEAAQHWLNATEPKQEVAS